MTQHLRIGDFVPEGQFCHYGRTELRQVDHPELHEHDFHEVFWIDSGSGWEHVPDGRREVHAGMVTLVHARNQHAFGVDRGASCGMCNLAFPVAVWDQLRRRCFPTADPFEQPDARVTVLEAGALRDLQDAATDIAAGARGMAAIERFLLNLMHLLERARARPSSEVPAWLHDAVGRLGEPEHLLAGTQALVAMCARSPEHVAREVRRCYGRTPTDLVNEARMAYAARRLSESRDAILDICYACGYSNLGHFYRLFRSAHGASPHQYRESHRRIIQPSA